MPGASRDTHVAANPRAVHGDFITVAHHGRRRAPDADLARIERRVDQPDWMSVKVAFLQRTFPVPNLYFADGETASDARFRQSRTDDHVCRCAAGRSPGAGTSWLSLGALASPTSSVTRRRALLP